MTSRSVRLCWVLVLLIGGAAQSAEPPEIVEVRGVYQRARSLIDAKKTRTTVVAEGPKGWSRVDSVDAVPHSQDSISDSAVLHVADGKIVMVELWIQTPSGDWQNRSENYYRSDGSLAFVLEEHLTYQTNSDDDRLPRPFVVETRRYFDASGKEIRSTKVARAANGKSVPVELAYQNASATRYPRIESLPFRSLVR